MDEEAGEGTWEEPREEQVVSGTVGEANRGGDKLRLRGLVWHEIGEGGVVGTGTRGK